METILEVLGNRKITLARELTKIHEDFTYGYVKDIIQNITPKGEYVIIVEANQNSDNDMIEKLNSSSLEEHFAFYKNLGYPKKEIIKMIAKDRKLPKNDIYQHFLN